MTKLPELTSESPRKHTNTLASNLSIETATAIEYLEYGRLTYGQFSGGKNVQDLPIQELHNSYYKFIRLTAEHLENVAHSTVLMENSEIKYLLVCHGNSFSKVICNEV